MLLNIDKVLKFLEEGKDIFKISELADTSPEVVSSMIGEARKLLNENSEAKTRKKIKLKKKGPSPQIENLNTVGLFSQAELSAVPIEDTLVMHIAVEKNEEVENEYVSAILVYDRHNNQVGKIRHDFRARNQHEAFIEACDKAIAVAEYFRAKVLKIRSDEDHIIRLINKEISTRDKSINEKIDPIMAKKSRFEDIKFETVDRLSNEKARFTSKNFLSRKQR